MSFNLNSTYHKGRFRNGEWSKHLKPYSKRLGNKKFRKTGRNLDEERDPLAKIGRYHKKKKTIKIKIKYRYFGDFTRTEIKKFHSVRDAKNSINRNNVINAAFLD